MRRIIYLVRQNLRRKPLRSLAMLVSILAGCATIYVALILSKGIQDTIVTASQRLGADLVVVPANAIDEAEAALISGNPTSFYMPAANEELIGAVAGVEQTAPQVFLRSLDAPCCVSQVALVGYEPGRDLTITPWSLRQTGKPQADNQIIVGAKVISAVVGTPAKAIGQRLIFMGKPFTVSTILEPTGLGTDFTVFVTMDTAYGMMADSPLYPVPVKRDQISAVMVKLMPGEDPARLAKAIEAAVPDVRAITASQLTRAVSGELEHVVTMLYISGGIFGLLALGLSATLFNLTIRQRMRELGIFRAMGASSGVIRSLIITECGLIAWAGAVCGVIVGDALLYIFKSHALQAMGSLYIWPSLEYFVLVAIILIAAVSLAGIAGGALAARQCSRLDPYESIRQGE